MERRYTLLGGLEAIEPRGRLSLGTHKQRAVLAQLLLAEGRVVTADRIVDGIWGDHPPERADASLQSYVSGLRRVLEPDRPPRAPSRVLVTRGSGYSLLVARDDVDVHKFVDLVTEGRRQHADNRLESAATVLRNALAMYAPLLPEFEHDPFRRDAAEHLERIHRSAQELSYEVRMALGEHRLVITDLEVAVGRDPLNEGLWALLALARYRMGRQSDALGALADCRRLLADEVGVDPGVRIRNLERDILSQESYLDAPTARAHAPSGSIARTASGPELVGRTVELATLNVAVVAARNRGDAVVLVEGDPGVGKSALLERAGAHSGMRTLWGRSVDGAAAPSMWPWVQILTQVIPDLDEDERRVLFDTELGRLVVTGATVVPPPRLMPDAEARFRLFDQAADLLDEVAARFPVFIVLDDMQWADAASLGLFVHMATRRPRGAVLVGALRTRTADTRPALEHALTALSRLPGHRRIELGPLGPARVSELVAREIGSTPTRSIADAIASRSGGNPFYVRELSRLLSESGQLDNESLALSGVPASILDVVRGRLDGIGTETTELLQLAALIGKQVDLGLVARAADLDVEATLTLLEPAEKRSLLAPTPDDPFSFRFAHDLVRQAIATSVPHLRARQLHRAVADALDAGGRRGDVTEQLAHHLWSAGPLVEPRRTAIALLDSARAAMRTYAQGRAARLAQSALTLAAAASDATLEAEARDLLAATSAPLRFTDDG